jgi:hypothetical protein
MKLIYSLTDGVKSVNIHTEVEPYSVTHNVIIFKNLFRIIYENGSIIVQSLGYFNLEIGSWEPEKVSSKLHLRLKIDYKTSLSLTSNDGENIILELTRS